MIADDGEDKLQKQSIAERKEPMEIAEHYTYTYFRDMDALNVLRPDYFSAGNRPHTRTNCHD